MELSLNEFFLWIIILLIEKGKVAVYEKYTIALKASKI